MKRWYPQEKGYGGGLLVYRGRGVIKRGAG